MDQEQEHKPKETEPAVASTEEESATEPLDLESAEDTEWPPTTTDFPAEKGGRMVVAGLVAAVIVSVIALLVVAIFQITSRWLVTCPTDLPVNDPAPILWKAMVSEKIPNYQLGVPEEMLKEAGFKGEKSELSEAQPLTRE